MPDIISKGVILSKLDEALNDLRHRETLRLRLIEWEAKFGQPNRPRLETLGTDISVGLQYHLLTPQEKAHMKYDWFKRWWLDAQDNSPTGKDGVEWVLGNGLLELINIANSQCCNKIIDCYWVCAAQHDHACAHPKGQGVTSTPYVPEPATPAEARTTQAVRGAVAAPPTKPSARPSQQSSAAPVPYRQARKNDPVCTTEERVDCSITWSRAQITFTIHTPPPGSGYYWDARTMTVPEPIVVVKWDEVNNQLLRNNPTRSAYIPQ